MQAQALHMVGWVIHMNNFAVFHYGFLTHGNAHLYNEMQPEIPSLVFCIKARGGREGDPTALYQGGVADYQQCQAGAGVA